MLLRICLKSVRSDAEKSVRKIMCGGINVNGTSNGKARKVGRSTVNVGSKRIRFELCG